MKTNPASYLLFFVLFLNVSIQNLSANTYVVNNTGDYSPRPSAMESPIVGTLRWAVEQADMNPGPDTITFDLSYPATITLSSGFPVFLTTDIVIEGPGKDNLTISGNNITRHFWAQNGTIFITGLTLANGRAKGGNGSGGGMGAGGSIFMHEGSKNTPGDLTMCISDVNFENNQAIGGAAASYGVAGGGLGGNGGFPAFGQSGSGGGGVFGNGGNDFIASQPIYLQNGGGGGSFENGQNATADMVGMGGMGNILFGDGGDGAFEDYNSSTPSDVPGNGEYGGGGGGKTTASDGAGGLGGFGGGGGSSLVGGAGGFGGGGGNGNSGGWGGAGGFGGGSGQGSASSQVTFSGFGGGMDEETEYYTGGAGGMGAGGAIFVTTGNLILKEVHFSMNSTTGGSGVTGLATGEGHGGAIFVFDHTRFAAEVTNQIITSGGFTNPSSVITCNVTYENNTASTPTESDNDVFGPVSENPLSCFEITGRDTSICPGELVNLEDFIDGLYTTLYFGTSFGSYPNEIGQVMPIATTTYYIADSMDGMLIDTAMITITVSTTLECFMDISSDNQIKFGHPCFCDQVVNSGGVFYFRDTLIIEADAGQEIRFSTSNASDFYAMPGVPMPDGTLFEETEPGVYKLEFYKLSNAQAFGSITLNGGEPFAIPEEDLELCYVNVDCPALIPTMGQWGLILLSILTLILGLLFIKAPHKSLRYS